MIQEPINMETKWKWEARDTIDKVQISQTRGIMKGGNSEILGTENPKVLITDNQYMEGPKCRAIITRV